MARCNEVSMTGILRNPPIIKKDLKTGDLKMAIAELLIVRGKRSRSSGQQYSIYANPCVITSEIKLIQAIETWQQWDVVLVKGFIGTKRVRKPSSCKFCGTRNAVNGDLGYVEPIFAEVIKHAESETAAIKFLGNYKEISNHFASIGNVVHDPRRLTVYTNRCGEVKLCQYQIALNRTYHVQSDSPLKRADFPWVKSYGTDCDEDYYRLKKNATVYIDGFIQTRRILRHSTCPVCGASYDWIDRTLEIVPYRSEYLQNCRSTEEVENMKLCEDEQAYLRQTASYSRKASYGEEVMDERYETTA